MASKIFRSCEDFGCFTIVQSFSPVGLLAQVCQQLFSCRANRYSPLGLSKDGSTDLLCSSVSQKQHSAFHPWSLSISPFCVKGTG